MAKGLRRTAFDQASYDYWTKQYGIVNVKDYGAILDGVHDDTAAIQAAWNAMGTPAQGTFYIPPGIAKISSTLNFLGGYSGAGNDSDVISTGASFRIICDGALQPVAGIGIAVKVGEAYSPDVQLRIFGGGSSTDNAVAITDMTGLVITVDGINFAGTVLYYDYGTNGIARVNTVNGGRIHALKCGAALYLSGTNGFGYIDSVWDDNSSSGSVISGMEDVSIGHYENYTTISGTSLLIENSGSIHLAIVSLGNAATTLLEVSGSGGGETVAIDRLFLIGNGSNTGLLIANSGGQVQIGNLYTETCSKGVWVQGSNLTVTQHYDLGSNNALVVDVNGTSTGNEVAVNCNYSSNVTEAVVVTTDVAGGYLQLSGNIGGTNTSGASGIYAIDVETSNTTFQLFLVNLIQRYGTLAGGVGIPQTSNVINSGSLISSGIVTT